MKVEKLGFLSQNESDAKKLIHVLTAIELGRIVTRDIGGSDPERMAAPRVAEYVQQALGSNIKVRSIKDLILNKKY